MKQGLYIITIEFGGQQKRLYLEGEDSEEAQRAFKHARMSLNEIGGSSTEFSEFLERAVHHFAESGFERIKK